MELVDWLQCCGSLSSALHVDCAAEKEKQAYKPPDNGLLDFVISESDI